MSLCQIVVVVPRGYDSCQNLGQWMMFLKDTWLILILTWVFLLFFLYLFAVTVPELQGEPDDITREKCRLAAKEVGDFARSSFF